MSENVRVLKIDNAALQKLESFINDQEDMGQFLNAMGLLGDDELAAGIHKLEDFRVKVEADPELAASKARELEETGSIAEVREAEAG